MEPHATRRAALHAGLGLSIVCSITAAHSGTVRARRPAGGLIVEIDLTPAPSPAGEH
jgi:K+-sensing histidine kinase KdpD